LAEGEWSFLRYQANEYMQMKTNGFIPDTPGYRGVTGLDSVFVGKGGAWWGCNWVCPDGKRGFIVNSTDANHSEFIACDRMWFFNAVIYGTTRPILIYYRQELSGVRTLYFFCHRRPKAHHTISAQFCCTPSSA